MPLFTPAPRNRNGRRKDYETGIPDELIYGPQAPTGLKGLALQIPKILGAIGAAYGQPQGLQYIEGQEAQSRQARESLFDRVMRAQAAQRAQRQFEAEYGEGGLAGLRRRQLEGAIGRQEATPMPGSPEETKRAADLARAGRAGVAPTTRTVSTARGPVIQRWDPEQGDYVTETETIYNRPAEAPPSVIGDLIKPTRPATEERPIRPYAKPDTSIGEFEFYLMQAGGDPVKANELRIKDKLRTQRPDRPTAFERQFQLWLQNPQAFTEFQQAKDAKAEDERKTAAFNMALKQMGLDRFRLNESDEATKRAVYLLADDYYFQLYGKRGAFVDESGGPGTPAVSENPYR